jgi:serine/threonine protein kinase
MQIGPYTVNPQHRREGGQAFVYFAADPRTAERIAIKVARPSEWSRRRLKEEIRVQNDLDHPNVLPILAHDEGFGWYATYRADCSLEDVGPFPREQWINLRVGLMGVASALAHAHGKGYIHRDISSGNVLIFKAGWAVSDWGFVYAPPKKGAPRMTQPLERFGTPEFMAPEMAADPMNVDKSADVYAMGRLAVWGTGLKRGETAPDDDRAVMWWRRLIDGTTAYEPNTRWTMRDVETHLRAKLSAVPDALRGLSVEPPPMKPPVRIGRPDPCPHCLSQLGHDSAERCLGCHAIIAY